MAPTDEDRRQSVSITVTLSSQIMSAALTMLGVHAAFVTFLVDKRLVGVAFKLAAMVAFAGFILGIFYGGRGIRALSYGGADGTWQLSAGKPAFNKQALFSLVGLIAFGASLILAGPARPSTPDPAPADSTLKALRDGQLELRRTIDSLRTEVAYVRGRADAAVSQSGVRKPASVPTKRP